MSSQRRIESSRANGAKSKGPKTKEGKLRSSRNSRRHGVLARTIVLDDERAASFTALLTAFETQLEPTDEVEKGCVENMAVARWRMMRLWGIEKASLQFQMSRQETGLHDAPTNAAIAFRALCDNSRSADLLNRYEIRYDRQYARALSLLLKWRAARAIPEIENFQTNLIPLPDTGDFPSVR